MKNGLGVVGVTALTSAGLAAVPNWGSIRGSIGWYGRGMRAYAAEYIHAYLPLEERIRKTFDHLTIDDAGLRQFVIDFERNYGKPSLSSPRAQSNVSSQFLLSTDFFLNGADESKIVRYMALYDPYVSPCWNPFPLPGSA